MGCFPTRPVVTSDPHNGAATPHNASQQPVSRSMSGGDVVTPRKAKGSTTPPITANERYTEKDELTNNYQINVGDGDNRRSILSVGANTTTSASNETPNNQHMNTLLGVGHHTTSSGNLPRNQSLSLNISGGALSSQPQHPSNNALNTSSARGQGSTPVGGGQSHTASPNGASGSGSRSDSLVSPGAVAMNLSESGVDGQPHSGQNAGVRNIHSPPAVRLGENSYHSSLASPTAANENPNHSYTSGHLPPLSQPSHTVQSQAVTQQPSSGAAAHRGGLVGTLTPIAASAPVPPHSPGAQAQAHNNSLSADSKPFGRHLAMLQPLQPNSPDASASPGTTHPAGGTTTNTSSLLSPTNQHNSPSASGSPDRGRTSSPHQPTNVSFLQVEDGAAKTIDRLRRISILRSSGSNNPFEEELRAATAAVARRRSSSNSQGDNLVNNQGDGANAGSQNANSRSGTPNNQGGSSGGAGGAKSRTLSSSSAGSHVGKEDSGGAPDDIDQASPTKGVGSNSRTSLSHRSPNSPLTTSPTTKAILIGDLLPAEQREVFYTHLSQGGTIVQASNGIGIGINVPIVVEEPASHGYDGPYSSNAPTSAPFFAGDGRNSHRGSKVSGDLRIMNLPILITAASDASLLHDDDNGAKRYSTTTQEHRQSSGSAKMVDNIPFVGVSRMGSLSDEEDEEVEEENNKSNSKGGRHASPTGPEKGKTSVQYDDLQATPVLSPPSAVVQPSSALSSPGQLLLGGSGKGVGGGGSGGNVHKTQSLNTSTTTGSTPSASGAPTPQQNFFLSANDGAGGGQPFFRKNSKYTSPFSNPGEMSTTNLNLSTNNGAAMRSASSGLALSTTIGGAAFLGITGSSVLMKQGSTVSGYGGNNSNTNAPLNINSSNYLAPYLSHQRSSASVLTLGGSASHFNVRDHHHNYNTNTNTLQTSNVSSAATDSNANSHSGRPPQTPSSSRDLLSPPSPNYPNSNGTSGSTGTTNSNLLTIDWGTNLRDGRRVSTNAMASAPAANSTQMAQRRLSSAFNNFAQRVEDYLTVHRDSQQSLQQTDGTTSSGGGSGGAVSPRVLSTGAKQPSSHSLSANNNSQQGPSSQYLNVPGTGFHHRRRYSSVAAVPEEQAAATTSPTNHLLAVSNKSSAHNSMSTGNNNANTSTGADSSWQNVFGAVGVSGFSGTSPTGPGGSNNFAATSASSWAGGSSGGGPLSSGVGNGAPMFMEFNGITHSRSPSMNPFGSSTTNNNVSFGGHSFSRHPTEYQQTASNGSHSAAASDLASLRQLWESIDREGTGRISLEQLLDTFEKIGFCDGPATPTMPAAGPTNPLNRSFNHMASISVSTPSGASSGSRTATPTASPLLNGGTTAGGQVSAEVAAFSSSLSGGVIVHTASNLARAAAPFEGSGSSSGGNNNKNSPVTPGNPTGGQSLGSSMRGSPINSPHGGPLSSSARASVSNLHSREAITTMFRLADSDKNNSLDWTKFAKFFRHLNNVDMVEAEEFDEEVAVSSVRSKQELYLRLQLLAEQTNSHHSRSTSPTATDGGVGSGRSLGRQSQGFSFDNNNWAGIGVASENTATSPRNLSVANSGGPLGGDTASNGKNYLAAPTPTRGRLSTSFTMMGLAPTIMGRSISDVGAMAAAPPAALQQVGKSSSTSPTNSPSAAATEMLLATFGQPPSGAYSATTSPSKDNHLYNASTNTAAPQSPKGAPIIPFSTSSPTATPMPVAVGSALAAIRSSTSRPSSPAGASSGGKPPVIKRTSVVGITPPKYDDDDSEDTVNAAEKPPSRGAQHQPTSTNLSPTSNGDGRRLSTTRSSHLLGSGLITGSAHDLKQLDASASSINSSRNLSATTAKPSSSVDLRRNNSSSMNQQSSMATARSSNEGAETPIIQSDATVAGGSSNSMGTFAGGSAVASGNAMMRETANTHNLEDSLRFAAGANATNAISVPALGAPKKSFNTRSYAAEGQQQPQAGGVSPHLPAPTTNNSSAFADDLSPESIRRRQEALMQGYSLHLNNADERDNNNSYMSGVFANSAHFTSASSLAAALAASNQKSHLAPPELQVTSEDMDNNNNNNLAIGLSAATDLAPIISISIEGAEDTETQANGDTVLVGSGGQTKIGEDDVGIVLSPPSGTLGLPPLSGTHPDKDNKDKEKSSALTVDRSLPTVGSFRLNSLQAPAAGSRRASFVASTSPRHFLRPTVRLRRFEVTPFAKGLSQRVKCIAMSPRRPLLAVCHREERQVHIHSLLDGSVVRTLSGHKDSMVGIAFSVDNKAVATASRDKTLTVWDSTVGHELGVVEHPGIVTAVAFSFDGKNFYTGCQDNMVRRFGTHKCKYLRCMQPMPDSSAGVIISLATQHHANEMVLCSRSCDCSVLVLDAITLDVLHILTGHTSMVWQTTFNADGSRIVTLCEKRVVVWDASTLQPVQTLDVAKVVENAARLGARCAPTFPMPSFGNNGPAGKSTASMLSTTAAGNTNGSFASGSSSASTVVVLPNGVLATGVLGGVQLNSVSWTTVLFAPAQFGTLLAAFTTHASVVLIDYVSGEVVLQLKLRSTAYCAATADEADRIVCGDDWGNLYTLRLWS